MEIAWDSAQDAELLSATVRGERQAFAAFYRRRLPAVLAYLMRVGAGRELAGDLAAEVFAAALLGAERYEPRHASALPWLCGIARRKLADTHRRGRVEDRARRRLGIPREQLDDADLERTVELASSDRSLSCTREAASASTTRGAARPRGRGTRLRRDRRRPGSERGGGAPERPSRARPAARAEGLEQT